MESEVSGIVIRITPEQSKRINALVKKCCANCVRGNCLLLDDGDEHPCPQLISFSRIMYNYLRDIVLPIDKVLYAELFKERTKPCMICGKRFISNGRNHKYCPECAKRRRKEKDADWQRHNRSKRRDF